jgi:hypothetical protein
MDAPALTAALGALRRALAETDLALELDGRAAADDARRELVAQIDDYLLPRLDAMEAPLLMVVGGSTGAGKSTLVNSIVGFDVSPSGVLRPTTRAPVLVCHPDDRRWFEDERILPELARTTGGPAGPGGLQLAPTDHLPAGMALLDAPDIDSVVEANRALARQLLAAADAWLFVTTAARYADAVPWDLLRAARERGTALSLVLDRVAPEAVAEVSAHLREMLAERGLGDAELLVVPEVPLRDSLLPADAMAGVQAWLDALTGDAQARAGLVARTLAGALESLPARVEIVERAAAAQQTAANGLSATVADAYADARTEVDDAVRNGALLRGEVLSRWHEVVGTGDLMRALESRVGRLRDRLRTMVTGTPAGQARLEGAVEAGVEAVVRAAADRAAERTAREWRQSPGGRALLQDGARIDAASPELVAATADEVRAWQRFVFDMVREEGQDKRATARIASLGVNGAGLVVMVAVFASTGGLTGTEVVVAGGTSALSQKLLEALFGDEVVRRLAARARENLLERAERVLALDAERFEQRLPAAAGMSRAIDALAAARDALEAAR